MLPDKTRHLRDVIDTHCHDVLAKIGINANLSLSPNAFHGYEHWGRPIQLLTSFDWTKRWVKKDRKKRAPRPRPNHKWWSPHVFCPRTHCCARRGAGAATVSAFFHKFKWAPAICILGSCSTHILGMRTKVHIDLIEFLEILRLSWCRVENRFCFCASYFVLFENNTKLFLKVF